MSEQQEGKKTKTAVLRIPTDLTTQQLVMDFGISMDTILRCPPTAGISPLEATTLHHSRARGCIDQREFTQILRRTAFEKLECILGKCAAKRRIGFSVGTSVRKLCPSRGLLCATGNGGLECP